MGHRPTWRRDLYIGTEWPLDPAHRLRIVRGDGSDIRTVWELSRGYHLLPLARAYRASGEARYRDAFVRHLDSWIEHNPLGYGPNWASPMDAGIRAANWIIASILFADAEGIPSAFWQRVLANLYSTGLFLERHLEWHPVYRGNHFVSNGVGLVYLGALFRDTRAGARWLRRGARILTEEMERQVGPDGVSFEASLAYHRLVTEFFAFGGELLELNLPGSVPETYWARLRAMYRFIACYLPESGEAPMIGDADDGRLHVVSARGWLEPRRHALGLPEGYWPDEPPGSAAFPEGGFYVLRSGANHAVVRCGPVGLRGAGSHDHNDQLGFELVLAGRRVVSDSGTYAYTRDLAARFAFRSTAAHSVVQLGAEEQNPIRLERPWRVLADRTRSECVLWSAEAGQATVFEGRHHGFAHRASGAVCERRISLGEAPGTCAVRDRVTGFGSEPLTWRLHFAELGAEIEEQEQGRWIVLLPGSPEIWVTVRSSEPLRARVESTPASDRYGVRYERSCLVLEGIAPLPVEISARFEAIVPAPADEDEAGAPDRRARKDGLTSDSKATG